MSAELRHLIDRELQLLDRLVQDHEEFIAKTATVVPGLIEREAAASMLHSFYTGVESALI